MTRPQTPWNDTYKARRGETAAIVPAEYTVPAEKMTDEQFEALLALERRRLIEQGRKLIDPEWRERSTVRREDR